MALTVEAVSKELDEAEDKAGDRELDIEEVTASLSHGSLMGRTRQFRRHPVAGIARYGRALCVTRAAERAGDAGNRAG